MQDELYGWIKSYENNLIKIYNQTAFSRDLGSQLAGTDLMPGTTAQRIPWPLPRSILRRASMRSTSTEWTIALSATTEAPPRRVTSIPEDIYEDPVANNAHVVSAYVQSEDRVMLVSSYHNASRDRDVIRFVLKIYSNNVTRKIGYIVCDVDTGSFLRIIAKYVYSERQIVWLQPRGDRPALRYGRLEGRQKEYFDIVSTQDT